MKFVFLTPQFYVDFKHCTELERKAERPYVHVEIMVNGYLCVIPLRSHLTHKNVLWTDKENACGLDFSKAVLLDGDYYIDKTRKPYIRPEEFKGLKGKEHIIKNNMESYIEKYKKAKASSNIERNAILCRYSSLQYFEEYIYTIDEKKAIENTSDQPVGAAST